MIDRRNPWTPDFHFWSQEKKHNPFDPNGAIFWKGTYHVFYLFQDTEVAPGECCWGHAASQDLVNWSILPPALVADRPGECRMYSGCALKTLDGKAALVYYSVGEGICIALAQDDDLVQWRKLDVNPVIPYLPEDDPRFRVYHVFDPHVWADGDHYNMILGSQAKPYCEYDTAYLFTSTDLIHWEYRRPFYTPTDHYSKRYDDCACPDFFRIGTKWMLLSISHTRGARYYLGDLVDDTFIPTAHHMLNFPGGNLFAPESLLDERGRRIAWFCMRNRLENWEQLPEMRDIMALPREFRPSDSNDAIRQFVPEELNALAGPGVGWSGVPEPGTPVVLPFQSRVCRIDVTIRNLTGTFVLDVLASKDGHEKLSLVFNREQERLTMDHSCARYPQRADAIICSRKGSGMDIRPRVQEVPWRANENGDYSFQVYVDKCIVEVFDTDGRFAASQMIFNAPDSDGIAIRLAQCSAAADIAISLHPMGKLGIERV